MKVVVAVTSCWKYRDTWKPFFLLKRRFWQDAPPTFLVTDDLGSKWPAYSFEPYCGYGTWVENLRLFTEKCTRENTLIIHMQDDFWLNAPVDNWMIDRAVHMMLAYNAGCVRLYPCPGATGCIPNGTTEESFGVHLNDEPYLISCQAALWHPRYLLKVLENIKGTTAADFEIEGTKYAAENMGQLILSVYAGVDAIPYICSAVSRGKWNPQALEFARAQGIEVDMSLREVECP